MNKNNSIWVLAEHDGKDVAEVTLEILGEARRLADQSSGEVAALLLGHHISPLADELAHYGADKVYLLEHQNLQFYYAESFVSVISTLIGSSKPLALLCGATIMGRDLMPRLAARMQIGLVSNCTIFKIDREGQLEMIGPTYGDKFYFTKICPLTRPQLATVLPGSIGVGKPDTSRHAEVVVGSPLLDSHLRRIKKIGVIKADPRTVDISEADVIVVAGRGVGDTEHFSLIQELADLLSGSVAGSRLAVDAGWIPFERQIGQTGKTVAPKLIISCGVSGATHHTMGMKDSKQIVAINIDRAALIFKIAHVSILADLHQLLPEVITRLRQTKASPK